jgi:hypothetical protein
VETGPAAFWEASAACICAADRAGLKKPPVQAYELKNTRSVQCCNIR